MATRAARWTASTTFRAHPCSPRTLNGNGSKAGCADGPPLRSALMKRVVVLESIRRHAEIRNWLLYAVHVRSNHLHIVVEADVPPERAMAQFKAYASRSLSRSAGPRRKRWAHHGSTRYLWQPRQISAAVDYVLNQQGRPMAIYRNPEPWKPIEPAKHHPPSPERK